MSYFKKIIMGLKDKTKSKPPTQPKPDTTLTKEELETLLFMIKNSTFKGEDIQTIYQLTVKLQHLYLNQN